MQHISVSVVSYRPIYHSMAYLEAKSTYKARRKGIGLRLQSQYIGMRQRAQRRRDTNRRSRRERRREEISRVLDFRQRRIHHLSCFHSRVRLEDAPDWGSLHSSRCLSLEDYSVHLVSIRSAIVLREGRSESGSAQKNRDSGRKLRTCC